MPILESEDSNILDAETVNWRLVVYPLIAGIILLLGGFGYYSYLQNQRIVREDEAHSALVLAKSPEELTHVADQFPNTTQATLALLNAADLSYGKKDYDNALKNYQRITGAAEIDTELRDAAQLGVASTLEATNKLEEAIAAYLAVAHRSAGSPYAPFSYMAVAQIYDRKNDQENERKILTNLAALPGDSFFVKEAQSKLKTLNPSASPLNSRPAAFNAPAASSPSATPHS